MDVGPWPDEWFLPPGSTINDTHSLNDLISPLGGSNVEHTNHLAADLADQLSTVSMAWMEVKVEQGEDKKDLLTAAYKCSMDYMVAYWLGACGLSQQGQEPTLVRGLLASCVFGMSETYKAWAKENGEEI